MARRVDNHHRHHWLNHLHVSEFSDSQAPQEVMLYLMLVPTCICLFFVPNPWTMYDFYPMKEVPCPKLTDPSIFSTTYNFHGEEYQVNQT